MNSAEFYQLIFDSVSEDWTYDEGLGRATNRNNLSVSISLPSDGETRSFQEPWLNSALDRQGDAQDYFLCYNGVPFSRGIVVHADGARIIIPVPTPHLKLSQLNYKIGLILNHFRKLDYDQYLKQFGIIVE